MEKNKRARARRALPALLCVLLLAGCAAARDASPTPGPAGESVPTPSPTAAPWVTVGGRNYYAGSGTLTLPADTGCDELLETLGRFPALTKVTFTGGAVDRAAQDVLRAAFPEIEFCCDTVLLGRVWPYAVTELSLAGEALNEDDLDELATEVHRLPFVERADLTGCGLSDDALHALDEALDGVDVVWTIPVYGREFRSTDPEIDLSEIKVTDGGAEIEAKLPYFSGCGISDEAMDELNRRHDAVRFVWEVKMGAWKLRTDDTNFCVNRRYSSASLYSWHCEALKYCPDLIALDLGHRNVTTLDFLKYTPHLQYLILAAMPIRDLTPISSLHELKYLELFLTKAEDLSPLAECTALQDLNISYVYAKPDNAFDTLMRMPWLERLWYCGCPLDAEHKALLQANMPGCEMYLDPHGESTGSTWRTHEHYYEMRDIFGMRYMEGGMSGMTAERVEPEGGDDP